MGDEALKQAMSLIIAGNRRSAGELLAGIVRTDPKNEMAWLYLSYCVASSVTVVQS
jgi:Tfp pilus assembly protein PilF